MKLSQTARGHGTKWTSTKLKSINNNGISNLSGSKNNIFELCDLKKICNTYNGFRMARRSNKKNINSLKGNNRPSSPMFLRRGYLDKNKTGKMSAVEIKNWETKLKMDPYCEELELEEYVLTNKKKKNKIEK